MQSDQRASCPLFFYCSFRSIFLESTVLSQLLWTYLFQSLHLSTSDLELQSQPNRRNFTAGWTTTEKCCEASAWSPNFVLGFSYILPPPVVFLLLPFYSLFSSLVFLLDWLKDQEKRMESVVAKQPKPGMSLYGWTKTFRDTFLGLSLLGLTWESHEK